jgi:hypothetical protein
MSKKYEEYVGQWQRNAIKINEAMQKGDFELTDKLMKESADLYEKFKAISMLPEQYKGMSFGELNHIVENQLLDNKEVLDECIKQIKGDSNLLSQFRFINSLRNYNCEGKAVEYVTEALNMAIEKIDRKTIKESTEKFSEVLVDNDVENVKINEDEVKFYKNCAKLLSERKKMSNLSDYTNTLNEVADYVEKHKRENIDEMVQKLSDKMSQLTEDSRELVKDIINFKAPMVEERHKKILDKFKNECLSGIKKLKEETTDPKELQKLDGIKEMIESKEYCKETIVEDLAKMLEIRDILLEK